MSRRGRRPTTLIFAGAILALAAYSFYDYQNSKKETLGENELKIVTTLEDDFSEITIKSKAQTIQLKKDGVWKMLQPVVDETDEAGVSSLLSTLTNAKVQKIMEGESKTPIDWDKYGLAPGVLIEISSNKGKKESFSVSDSNAFDGSFYLRKGDELYLGDKTWARLADKQVVMLRSHKIWRASGLVTEVHFHYDYAGKVEDAVLTKGTDGGWKVKPAWDLPVDADKMMSWFDEMKDLRAIDFAAPNLTATDAKKFLLTKPSMKLELTLKKEDKTSTMQWTVGQDRDNDIFVATSERPDVFRVGKFSLRNVRVPIERLLDTAAVLHFSLEDAREVRLIQNGQTVRFLKGEKDWRMDPAPKSGSFRADALADFFQKLAGLEPIPDLLPNSVTFHPEKDGLTIVGKDKTLFQVSWSGEKEMLRWLKIAGVKEDLKVSSERFNALLKTKFVSDAKEKAKGPAKENR